MNVGDVVKYVLVNRKGKLLKDWSPYQLTLSIDTAIRDGMFTFCTDSKNNLTGVAWGVPNYVTKNIHIDAILTTHKDALKQLVQFFRDTKNEWTLTAERRTRFMIYNTPRLTQKILKGN